MCAICGRFNFDGKPVSAAEIAAMRDVMIHRGPDDQGMLVQGAVGLGHRRLSIIDLAGGHQPISNEDGTVTVVFNGEIYNFAEIRDGLIARGHTLTTRSDTEVIVHLYEELGAECVQRFRGMFAFALWDSRRQLLLLARDRLGVKPLYYARVGDSLVFSSEIKGLLKAEGLPAEIDPQGLRRYLVYRHPYGDGTLFKEIRQLPPGHYLLASARKVALTRYWDVPQPVGKGSQDQAAEFLPLLEESVKLRMISDVPIGSFLSGGIDSSVITALMARHTGQVRTFSIGFVPDDESELKWARTVARHCHTEHHEFVQEAGDFHSLLRKLIWHNDEPITFPASIPLFLLSRESKRVATVMLGGEGADEILAGYDTNVRTYQLARMAARIPAPLRGLIQRLSLPGRVGAIARRVALSERNIIASTYRLLEHESIAAACRIPLPAAAADDDALVGEVGLDVRGGTFLDRLLYFQLKTYLVALLMKQDKMSMAASIETRVPYLDHHLVGLAFRLSDGCKIQGASGKYLLKQVSRGLIPDQIIDRPKRGFPVPIDRWFRERGNPFVDVLLDPESLRDGLLEPEYVKGRVTRFLAGDEISIELWAMLNLELWRREYLVRGATDRACAPGCANHGSDRSVCGVGQR